MTNDPNRPEQTGKTLPHADTVEGPDHPPSESGSAVDAVAETEAHPS